MEDRNANGKVENFTGIDGCSMVARITRRNRISILPGLWLEEIDRYFKDEAERWADQTLAIKHLLDENTLDQ